MKGSKGGAVDALPMEPSAQTEQLRTKECRSCGRTLKIDQFILRAGRVPAYCRQCGAMAKADKVKISDVRADVREQMKTITATVDALYSDEGQPGYTIEDVLEEVRLGSDRYANLIRNTYKLHPALMADTKNAGAINSLLDGIIGTINDLRRT